MDQLFIALSPRSLICKYCKLRISLLAELSYNPRIVELVVYQERLRLLGSIDLYLRKRIVDGSSLIPLSHPRLQPTFQNTQLISFIELANRLLNRAKSTHVIKQLFYVSLVALQINQSAQNHRSCVRVHLEYVDLDVFIEAVLIKISSKFVDVAVHVAEEDERSWVCKSLFFEVVFDEFWIIAF